MMAKRLLTSALLFLYAAMVLGSVFVLLPARWLPVDLPSGIAGGLALLACLSLLISPDVGQRLAKWACYVAMVYGMSFVAIASFTAADLAGRYGPVGLGGAVVLAIVAALLFAYSVGMPLLALSFMRQEE